VKWFRGGTVYFSQCVDAFGHTRCHRHLAAQKNPELSLSMLDHQIVPYPPGGHVVHSDMGSKVSCNSDHHPDICSVGELVRLDVSIYIVLRVVASSIPLTSTSIVTS